LSNTHYAIAFLTALFPEQNDTQLKVTGDILYCLAAEWQAFHLQRFSNWLFTRFICVFLQCETVHMRSRHLVQVRARESTEWVW